MSEKTAARLRGAKTALKKRLARHPHVLAIGIGYRQRDGQIVQRGCLRVHVRKKLSLDEIPKRLRLPTSFRGTPIDVVESHFVSHAGAPDSRLNPLLGGAMVAGAAPFAAAHRVGSIACIVNATSGPLLLTCWHVLYGDGGQDGDQVFQPAPSAGSDNLIGTARVGVISKRVDCAVAELNTSRACSPRILKIPGAILAQTTGTAGTLVRKSGATGPGFGIILGEVDPPVAIDGKLRTFVDQIEIGPRPGGSELFNSAETDSGAVWLSEDDKCIVGLHFAGGTDQALANPIRAVVAALAKKGIDLGF